LIDIPIELIVSAKNGDKQAMEDLLDEVSPDLIRLIKSRGCDFDSAEDILQNSLIRIFRNLKSLKNENFFAAWAKKIAINQAYSFFTAMGKKKAGTSSLDELREIHEENLDDRISPIWIDRNKNIVDEIYRKEIFKILFNEVNKLPERRRMAMFIFYTKDVQMKEVAKEMGISEGAVRYHLYSGRKDLAERLSYFKRGGEIKCQEQSNKA
jgi:RNA polymerase sigma-70 factor (ECF subfamily)